MAKPFRGVINVDVTRSVPDWEPYTQPIAPEGDKTVGQGRIKTSPASSPSPAKGSTSARIPASR
jgi:hypothetical protein